MPDAGGKKEVVFELKSIWAEAIDNQYDTNNRPLIRKKQVLA